MFYMIDAYKSKFQDATYSDLVLLVVDISHQPIIVKNRLGYLIHKMNEQGMPMKDPFLLNMVYMIRFFTEVDIFAQSKYLCATEHFGNSYNDRF